MRIWYEGPRPHAILCLSFLRCPWFEGSTWQQPALTTRMISSVSVFHCTCGSPRGCGDVPSGTARRGLPLHWKKNGDVGCGAFSLFGVQITISSVDVITNVHRTARPGSTATQTGVRQAPPNVVVSGLDDRLASHRGAAELRQPQRGGCLPRALTAPAPAIQRPRPILQSSPPPSQN